MTPLIAPAVIFNYKNLGAEVGMFTDVMAFSLQGNDLIPTPVITLRTTLST
ncbi:hypothetical protein JCM19240_1049 [Vibrio maritimus]|uniref:Uncharacterized protein n=1 Tax=Vibrio maritimus TaxID=990268 RepID=A0A090T2G0_9VIBR|nr:hypothetical protein JCM19240_1049 [Vibrio maritimus]